MATSTDPCDPKSYGASKTALLLCDFQSLVVNMLAEQGKAALAKATALRSWALENKILVMHCLLDVSKPPRANAKSRDRIAGMLQMIKQQPDIADEAAELSSADSSGDGEVVVRKQLGTVSGLKSEGAMDILREKGIESLIVCGLSTSGAVLRTALSASDEGFVVTVVEDACADREESVHETLIEKVIPSSVWVVKADEVQREFGR